MGAIAQGFTWLLSKISEALSWIGQLFVQVFRDLWEIVTDVICWAFESMLSLVLSIVQVLDFSAVQQYLSTFDAIPPQIAEALAASGVGSALSIIGAALVVRLMLQLIPFTRLGS